MQQQMNAYMQALQEGTPPRVPPPIINREHLRHMAIVPVTPDGPVLDDFKNDVRTWMELDNSIRRLQHALKERKTAKKILTDRILNFMNRYNIEDLNTNEGCLRYKVTYVRPPLTQQGIKERISSYFEANQDAARDLHVHVFGNRDRAEKMSLRRLKLA